MERLPRKSHPEYGAWKAARNRCSNPTNRAYKDYGGRGIRMLIDFFDMLDEIGPKPTPAHQIDRIDNDGNYERGNIRWATPLQNTNNRRPRRVGFRKGPYKGRTEYHIASVRKHARLYGDTEGTYGSY